MAKSKLLQFLVILLLSISAVSVSAKGLVFAQNFDNANNEPVQNELLQKLENAKPTSKQLNWAKSMRNQGQNLTKNAIIQKLKELDSYKQGDRLVTDTVNTAVLTDNRAALKIFVSSSMPKNLLKVYHNQAVKYGGTLVFKGLPGGSFKELSRLILAISGNDGVGSMQIDDQTFDRFAVNSVPAILLIKEESWLDEEKQSCIIYDKITGGIGVKVALEKFAQNGDLAASARRLLEND